MRGIWAITRGRGRVEGRVMGPVLAWARLDVRRRWPSLVALLVLTTIASAAVMTAVTGARRGDSSLDRLLAQTLPATAQVAPNTGGFHKDWDRIAALPYVEAIDEYHLAFMFTIDGTSVNDYDMPPARTDYMRTIERPVVLQGRLFDPTRPDEVVVTQVFADNYHRRVGDRLTMRMPTADQIRETYNSGGVPLKGPVITLHIVGIVRTPWLDLRGQQGRIAFSPGLAARYHRNLWGMESADPARSGEQYAPANALVRLTHGADDLGRLRADLTRMTGRSDIEVINLESRYAIQRHTLAFEAGWLWALAGIVSVASVALIGQSISRAVGIDADARATGRAIGLAPAELRLGTTLTTAIATALGGLVGAGIAVIASAWFPVGLAARLEPDPGARLDLLPLVLIGAGSTAVAALIAYASAGQPGARPARPTSAVRAWLARLELPAALHTTVSGLLGRATATSMGPALSAAIAAVIGIVAVCGFTSALREAQHNPSRFGQTWQIDTLLGFNGFDAASAATVIDGLRSLPYVDRAAQVRMTVTGLPGDAGALDVWSLPHQGLDAVVVDGRLPAGSDEIALAPGSVRTLHLHLGESLRLTGTDGPAEYRLVGEAFVPTGVESDYDDGGWVTDAGYARLTRGFGMHLVLGTVAPAARDPHVADRARTDIQRGHPERASWSGNFGTPAQQDMDVSGSIAQLDHVRELPVILGVLLAMIALGTVTHHLISIVRRQRQGFALLRTLGMTPAQSGATILAHGVLVAGGALLVGLPLGIAGARTLWRVVATYMPLQYADPSVRTALFVTCAVGLVTALLLAIGPAISAARLKVADTLRSE